MRMRDKDGYSKPSIFSKFHCLLFGHLITHGERKGEHIQGVVYPSQLTNSIKILSRKMG